MDKQINQGFESIEGQIKRLRRYNDEQKREMEKHDVDVAKLDSQISQMQNMQKQFPDTADLYDVPMEAIRQKRDAINAKPRENLEKFLNVLQIVDKGIKVVVDSEIVKLGAESSVLEPQEMDDMTEVVDKKKKKKM